MAAAAALGLAACTPEATSMTTPTSTPTSETSASVVTEQVTETVTRPAAPPTKPVIDPFGYGALKLGMTRQQALDTKLIGPTEPGYGPQTDCTAHKVVGTGASVFVSNKLGVSTIFFTPEMTSTDVGKGSTEAAMKKAYPTVTNAPDRSFAYSGPVSGNDKAFYMFNLDTSRNVSEAAINLKGQDCHS